MCKRLERQFSHVLLLLLAVFFSWPTLFLPSYLSLCLSLSLSRSLSELSENNHEMETDSKILLSYQDIPKWQQSNNFILSGYR